MAVSHLDRLSATDASFLTEEKEAAHMHIGGVCVFEGPPPSYDEADVSDKPAWVRAVAPWTPAQVQAKQVNIRKSYQSLLSVDDIIEVAACFIPEPLIKGFARSFSREYANVSMRRCLPLRPRMTLVELFARARAAITPIGSRP